MAARTLASVIDASTDADAVALLDLSGSSVERYTYADLRRRVRAVAAAVARNYPSCSRVGLLCSNSARFLVAWLGATRAGCTVVPFNPRAGAEANEFVYRDAALDLVFTEGPVPEGLPAAAAVVDIAGEQFDGWWSAEEPDTIDRTREPALVLYTSGSTGRPKGVMLSHDSQLAILRGLDSSSLRAVLAHGPSIVAAPLFHMNGLLLSALTFWVGGTAVLLRRFDASAFLRAIESHGVAVVTGVPTMIALLADVQREIRADLSSVKLVMIGSAPLSEAVLRHAYALFPHASVLNSYGTTEIGAGIFGTHPQGLARPGLSIGHPAPHAEIRLVRGPSSDMGVLEVRTRTAMTGYLNLPELTASKVRDGWIDTGDVFRRDEHGFFYFVGRADDMFVCGGENIYPADVVRVIEQHPAVLQAAVVPVDDEVRGQMPVAFVVRRLAEQVSADEVKSFVLARAAPHLHPRRVWFVDALPLSAANKVDAVELTKRARRLMSQTDGAFDPGASGA